MKVSSEDSSLFYSGFRYRVLRRTPHFLVSGFAGPYDLPFLGRRFHISHIQADRTKVVLWAANCTVPCFPALHIINSFAAGPSLAREAGDHLLRHVVTKRRVPCIKFQA